MSNEKLRLFLRGSGVPMWLLADRLGVSEPTITRWFRKELKPDRARQIRQIVRDIQTERREANRNAPDSASNPHQ